MLSKRSKYWKNIYQAFKKLEGQSKVCILGKMKPNEIFEKGWRVWRGGMEEIGIGIGEGLNLCKKCINLREFYFSKQLDPHPMKFIKGRISKVLIDLLVDGLIHELCLAKGLNLERNWKRCQKIRLQKIVKLRRLTA